ncbi:hypothetical protein ACFFWC_03285 [Plantactinospora siamensis]|uniref:Uncharacterized protein n=1 Tax=Plantactinospora siamensis TaxID=555372 RepID=A0ABV6NQI9_9ACTN
MLRPSPVPGRPATAPVGTALAGMVLLIGAGPLGGCGAPPQPRATPGGSPAPSAAPTGVPSATGVPTGPTGAAPSLPGATVPPGGLPPTAGVPPPLPGGLPTLPGGVPPAPNPAPTARACGGRPSGAEVLAAVRRAGVVPAGLHATVATGPLCATDWQFTQFDVPGSDPLLVVTRRRGGGLTVVTAGSDVCSVDVSAAAPPAIQALACDAGQGGAA